MKHNNQSKVALEKFRTNHCENPYDDREERVAELEQMVGRLAPPMNPIKSVQFYGTTTAYTPNERLFSVLLFGFTTLSYIHHSPLQEGGVERCIPHLWNVNNGELIWPEKRRNVQYASSCVVYFGPSGKLIYTSEKGAGKIQIWDVDAGELHWTYPSNLPWRGENLISISPDESLFSLVSQDGTVRVFGINPSK